MQFESLEDLESHIPNCIKCPRLSKYTREVATKKVKRFNDWDYWGKPVPSFGDHQARVLVIGLAPAAHGANRTGRMFTGDSSGDWLYRALYETAFSNQPESYARDDGLVLNDIYISAMVRCAPPQNKPSASERDNCSIYLREELRLMKKQLKVIICLGGMAFRQFCKLEGWKGLDFGHLYTYNMKNYPTIITSYHPSRQNTNTGRLKWDDWVKVFEVAGNMVGK